MNDSWKREWRKLKESRPGRRFEDRYRRARGGSRMARVLRPVAGVLVALAGIALMPAPGPGWAVFIIGLALLASDFHWMARTLDWAEVRVRAIADRLKRWWSRSGLEVRIAASAAAGVVLVASAWGLWRLLFAR